MRRLWVFILILLLGAGRSSRAASAEGDVRGTAVDADETLSDDYDPWQRFNEKMFFFNHDSCMTFATRSRRSRSLLDPCS